MYSTFVDNETSHEWLELGIDLTANVLFVYIHGKVRDHCNLGQ